MSLRTDIHSAIDDIAPPAFGLTERILHSAAAAQRSGSKRFVRLRAPLALVAVVLMIALSAGVLVGGRVLQDLNNIHNAGTASRDPLAQLEARPVNLPILNASDPCPAIGRNHIGFDYGDGPVYVNGGAQGHTAWGQYWQVMYLTSPSLTGRVLVRGRDLKSDRMVVFLGENASGPVVGTDGAAGPLSRQHTELVLDAGRFHSQAANGTFGSFEAIQGIGAGWSGCLGLQIDGANFTEMITATNFVGG